MPVNGNQIKAARALLGWPQAAVADAAGLHVNSVKYWETRGVPKSDQAGLKAICAALEGQGVQFIPGGVVMASATA